jgi:hypothetical protein
MAPAKKQIAILREDEELDNQLLDEATAEEQRIEELEEAAAAERGDDEEEGESDEPDSEEEREMIRQKVLLVGMFVRGMPLSSEEKMGQMLLKGRALHMQSHGILLIACKGSYCTVIDGCTQCHPR